MDHRRLARESMIRGLDHISHFDPIAFYRPAMKKINFTSDRKFGHLILKPSFTNCRLTAPRPVPYSSSLQMFQVSAKDMILDSSLGLHEQWIHPRYVISTSSKYEHRLLDL